VNYKTACEIYEKEGIKPIELVYRKQVSRYDRRPGPRARYAIYPKVTIQGHTNACALYITNIQRPMILGKAWIKRHGLIIDTRDDSLDFRGG